MSLLGIIQLGIRSVHHGLLESNRCSKKGVCIAMGNESGHEKPLRAIWMRIYIVRRGEDIVHPQVRVIRKDTNYFLGVVETVEVAESYRADLVFFVFVLVFRNSEVDNCCDC